MSDKKAADKKPAGKDKAAPAPTKGKPAAPPKKK